jgi:hypothetical protein
VNSKKFHLGICCVVVGLSLLTAGCQVGQKAIAVDYPGYNEIIRQTEDEHMLLNLVRLRYVITPVFLQISSITTSYGVSFGTGVSATSGGPSSASVDAGFSESPTISYSLPESREFFGRMQAPLSANQLAVLGTSGVGGFFRMGVKTMNGLQNLSTYTGWVVQRPDSYDEFEEAIILMEELEREGLISFAIQVVPFPVASPFDEIDNSRAIPDGVKIGMEFHKNEDGKWVAYMLKKAPHLRFGPAAMDSPKALRLHELLGLNPAQHILPIIGVDTAPTEMDRIINKDYAAGLDPDTIWTEVALQNRSMGEIMLYASKSVQVPREDVDAGLTTDESSAMDDLLTILHSKERPQNAAVAVEFKNHWFYIRADDLKSKLTFSRLNALFAVTAGTVPGSQPVLTIPVGGTP